MSRDTEALSLLLNKAGLSPRFLMELGSYMTFFDREANMLAVGRRPQARVYFMRKPRGRGYYLAVYGDDEVVEDVQRAIEEARKDFRASTGNKAG